MNGVAALLLALAFCFGGGVGVGHYWATQSADAARTRATDEALADYRKQVADGLADAEQLREQLRLQARHATQLRERIVHARLLTARADPPATPCHDPAPAGAAPAARDEPAAAVAGDDGDAELTRGAVGLWNSALASPGLPAGACASADAADTSCAAGAGITVRSAWVNHAINAASCADDRIRYQRLIDYLKAHRP